MRHNINTMDNLQMELVPITENSGLPVHPGRPLHFYSRNNSPGGGRRAIGVSDVYQIGKGEFI